MKRSKNGDGGTGVYMREGTTSRVMVSDKPCGEFYDFYSVSPEYFGNPSYSGMTSGWRRHSQITNITRRHVTQQCNLRQ
jgi:hypothetical protein